MNNDYKPTGVEQTLKWGEHQAMLKSHINAKQARRELHKRTHGKARKYCGHFY